MKIKRICQSQWNDVKNIYMEAFPKAERKPFFFLKRAVRKGKSKIWVASESDVVAGFIVLIPYHDMILVEYLAVSNQIRRDVYKRQSSLSFLPAGTTFPERATRALAKGNSRAVQTILNTV